MKTMKQRLFFLFPLLLASFCLHAQSPSIKKYEKHYKDQLQEGEHMIWAYPTSIFIRTADGAFVKKTFYPEKKILTHYTTYKDVRSSIKHGPYKEWYDDGHLVYEGSHKDGEKDGIWKHYPPFFSGQVYTGNYVKGQREGLWIIQDSLGNTILEEHYKDGLLEGTYKVYNEAGELGLLRVYRAGEVIEETRYSDDLVSNMKEVPDIMPHMAGCTNADLAAQKTCSDTRLLNAIYSNINYPMRARNEGIEGTALFSFVVDKDGNMGKVTTLRGISADIEKECLKTIKKIPAWEAGQNNGAYIDVRFNLPVKFRLE
jgi:TonB family protein